MLEEWHDFLIRCAFLALSDQLGKAMLCPVLPSPPAVIPLLTTVCKPCSLLALNSAVGFLPQAPGLALVITEHLLDLV